MSDEITPALTPEEWAWQDMETLDEDVAEAANNTVPKFYHPVRKFGESFTGGDGFADNRHGVAALCLYGQPFGFTQEDVDALRMLGEDHDDTHEGHRLLLIADRIAALLPPSQP